MGKKKEIMVDFRSNPIAPNPFTTRSGEMPKIYLGREKELAEFTEILGELDRNRKDHFIVVGEWGAGKTTFLQRCTELAGEKNIVSAVIKTPEYGKSARQIDVVIDIIRQLTMKLPVPSRKLRNLMSTINSVGFSVLGSGVEASRETAEQQPFQPLLHEVLRSLTKDMRKYKAVMILLDDVQNLREIPQAFTTFRNVLTERDIVEESNILWGMACTPKAWNQFLTEKHHPMGGISYASTSTTSKNRPRKG